MGYSDRFYSALGITGRSSLVKFEALSSVPVERLKYYNDTNTLPSEPDLESVCRAAGITPLELTISMGRLDSRLLEALRTHAKEIGALIGGSIPALELTSSKVKKALQTKLGTLYQGDCLSLLATMESESVDLIFADPPFNLDKMYPSGIDDNLKEHQYLQWCEQWASECVRVLKPGGSLLIWNLPKWNTTMAEFLNGRLTFRHWIAVDIKYRLPIAGRLYPSHYSLLYYCKGLKPNTFHPDRMPMEVCLSCAHELRDYGGYKHKMNPMGINMADVWYDIPPVRHAKYKRREGANELSIKLLDRIIEMASNEGDLVFDPFGGAGTTYVIAEIKKRRWIGVEIGPVDDIVSRFKLIEEDKNYLNRLRSEYNHLFPPHILAMREERGLWTSQSVKKDKADRALELDFSNE